MRDVTTGWRVQTAGAVHVDGTTRPRIVETPNGSPLYPILHRFYKLTGIPVLLNTSFNLSDEPMVLSPDQAIATFFRSGPDLSAFEDTALRKNR